MHGNNNDALKARIVLALYDLADHEARQDSGICPALNTQARARLDGVLQLLRDSAKSDTSELIAALEAAEAYLKEVSEACGPKPA